MALPRYWVILSQIRDPVSPYYFGQRVPPPPYHASHVLRTTGTPQRFLRSRKERGIPCTVHSANG